MHIAVLKENPTVEPRVAATPETVKKLIDSGASVTVEKNAGAASSIADAEYKEAGAKVLATIPLGPVAGTGANITAMSYDGTLYLGIVSDPAAIADRPSHNPKPTEVKVITVSGDSASFSEQNRIFSSKTYQLAKPD